MVGWPAHVSIGESRQVPWTYLERALETPAHIYYKLVRSQEASAELGNAPDPLENPLSAQEPASL
jgi:hypothetical protein